MIGVVVYVDCLQHQNAVVDAVLVSVILVAADWPLMRLTLRCGRFPFKTWLNPAHCHFYVL